MTIKHKSGLLLSFIFFFLNLSAQDKDSKVAGSNEKIIYDVGFKTYETFDTSRQYFVNNDTIARPLLIHLWHPGKVDGNRENLRFKNYIDLIVIRENYTKTTDEINANSFGFVNAYLGYAKDNFEIDSSVTTQQVLDSPVKAFRNAQIIDNTFPVIIYAPSNSKTPIQNHVICEYLASHGFYVISVSSAGPNSIDRRDLGKSTLAQVEDMEFILDYLEKSLKINYSSVGLLGFSTGGLATSIFQMKHSETKAVFSMDGSQEYSLYTIIANLNEFEIDKTEIPYFLVGNQDSPSIYPYFNSIKSQNKLFYRMPYLGHFGFVSYWIFFDSCNPDAILHNYSFSYQAICESALAFFNATLIEDNKSNDKLLSLSLQENEYAIKEKIEYSEPTKLINTFLQENIDLAISTYKNNKATNFNNYNYSEEEISVLGRMIIDYDLGASEKLFLFNQQEYPRSWHVYFDLAFSYKIKGDKELAKKMLMKARAIEPDNNEIKDLMEQLEDEG